jgi:uncharacterized membrane protein (UPF0127 family)
MSIPLKVLQNLFCFILSSFLILSFSRKGFAQDKEKICFKEHCIEVELAQSKAELMRGLQFRDSLDADKGMLFIFPESNVYTFWMKNTSVPLDILWLDDSKKIIYIEKGVPPCKRDPCPTYGPEEKSRFVIEVNAGYVEGHHIQVGDDVEFTLKK